MPQDLADCRQLQAGAVDPFGSLSLNVGAELREDPFVEDGEIVAGYRFARGDRNFAPSGNREDPAADSAVVFGAITALPAHDGQCEAGEKVGMMGLDPEAAAGVFGAQHQYAILVYDNREWCRYA
jgi:hypothetical protein